MRTMGAGWGLAAALALSAPAAAQIAAIRPDREVTLAPQFNLTARLEAAIREALAGPAGAERVGRLRAAILRTLGPASRDEARAALGRIDPAAFSDPSAVAAAVVEARSLVEGERGEAAMASRQPDAEMAHARRPPPPPPPPAIQPRPPLPMRQPAPTPPAAKPAALPPVAIQQARASGPVHVSLPPSPAPAPAPPAPAPPAPAPTPAAPAALAKPGYTVTYNAPPVVPLGARTDFRLIIASARAAAAADFAGTGGPTHSHVVPRIALVKAMMTGPPDLVNIETSSPVCQQVTSRDNPTWDWYVTPKTTRPFALQVDLLEVADCAAAAPILHRVDSFQIKVTADPWQWLLYVAGPWKTALLGLFAVIGAAGGAFGAWKWLGRAKPAQ